MKALVILIIVVAGGMYAYPRVFQSKDPYPPPAGVTEGSREHLKFIAGELKKELPRKIDNELTATDIFARSGEMVYTYKLVNYSSAEIDARKFQELARTDLRGRVCKDRDIKRMWKHHDITLSFQFIASDGLSLGYLSVGPTDC